MFKKAILAAVLAVASTGAMASSYITGNVKHNDNSSEFTTDIEVGHTFSTNTTVWAEISGITYNSDEADRDIGLNMGVKQSFALTPNMTAAVGYDHITFDGEHTYSRIHVGTDYNFQNGIVTGVRVRQEFAQQNHLEDELRTDANVSYQLTSLPVNVKYNNVMLHDSDKMDHEFRVTMTSSNVQPYVEAIRTDAGSNDLKVGLTVGF